MAEDDLDLHSRQPVSAEQLKCRKPHPPLPILSNPGFPSPAIDHHSERAPTSGGVSNIVQNKAGPLGAADGLANARTLPRWTSQRTQHGVHICEAARDARLAAGAQNQKSLVPLIHRLGRTEGNDESRDALARCAKNSDQLQPIGRLSANGVQHNILGEDLAI